MINTDTKTVVGRNLSKRLLSGKGQRLHRIPSELMQLFSLESLRQELETREADRETSSPFINKGLFPRYCKSGMTLLILVGTKQNR